MPAPTQSCLRHPTRPAVARCTSCRESFCRECVVEHDFKLVCAECLRARVARQASAKPGIRLPFAPMVQAVLGLALVWLVFYLAGLLIGRIPNEVHDGLIWTR